MKRQMAQGYEAWVEWLTDLKEYRIAEADRRAKKNKALRHMLNRALSMSFSRWYEAASALKRQRLILQRALVKVAKREMAQGFEAWVEWLVDLREYRIAEADRRAKKNKVLRHMLNRALSMSFGRWYEAASALKRQRLILQRALVKVAKREMAQGYEAWVEWLTDLREYRIAEADRRAKKNKALRHMLNRALSMSFGRWYEAASALKRQRLILQRALVKVAKREMAQGYEAWVEWLTDLKEYRIAEADRRAKKNKALRHMLNRALSMSFGRWYEAASALKRQRLILQRALVKVAKREMAQGYEAWVEWLTDLKEYRIAEADRRAKKNKVLRHMLNRALSMSFGRWYEAASALKRQRLILQRALVKVAKREMAQGYEAWVEWLTDLREYRIAEADRRAKKNKALRHMLNRALSMSFGRWYEAASALKRQRLILQRALVKVAKREMAQGYEAWVEWLTDLKEYRIAEADRRAKKNKALRYMLNRALSMSFGRWYEAASALKRQRLILQRALVKVAKREMAQGYEAWVEWLTDLKEYRIAEADRRAKKNKALRHMLNRALSMSFGRWYEAASALKRQRLILQRALVKVAKREMAQGYEAWVEWLTDLREYRIAEADRRAKKNKALRHMLNRALSMSFGRWYEAASALKRQRLILQRALVKVAKREMAQGYEAWVEWLTDLKEYRIAEADRRAKKNKALRYMLNRALSMSFGRWYEAASALKRQRLILQRALVKVAKREMAQGYEAWVEWLTDLKEYRIAEADRRAKKNKALRHMLNRALSMSFGRWYEAASALKRQRLILQRALVKVAKREMAQGYEAWVEWLTDLREYRIAEADRRAKKNKALRHMLNRALSMSFGRWYEAASALKRQRLILQRALVKVAKREMAQGFEAWVEWLVDLREYRIAEADRRAKKNKALRHMLNRALSMSFGRWYEAASALKRQRLILQRALVKVAKREMAQGFEAWVEWLTDLKEYRIAKAERRAKKNKALRHMLNRALSMSFSRWYEATMALREQRAKLTKAIARIALVAAYAAMTRWREVVATNNNRRTLLRKAAGRLLYRQQRLAFAKWYELWTTAKHQRLAVARSLGRMLNRIVGGAFMAWQDWLEEIRMRGLRKEQVKAHRQRVILHMLNRRISLCFVQWNLITRKMNRDRSILRRSLMKVTQREMAHAFESWVVLVDDLRLARIAAAEKKRKKERALRHMFNRCIGMAFVSWQMHAHEAKRSKVIAQKILGKIMNGCLSRAFDSWLYYIDLLRKKRLQRQRASQILYNILNSVLMSAFNQWLFYAQDRVAKKNLLRKIIIRFGKLALATAFGSWFEAVSNTKQSRAKASRALARMTNRSLANAFLQWIQKSEDAKRHRGLLKKAAYTLTNGCLARAYKQWFGVVKRSNEQRALLGKALGRIASLAAAAAWRSWTEFVQVSKDRRVIMRKVAGKMRNRKVSAAFSQWKDLIATTKRQRALVRRHLARVLSREIAESFERWTTWLIELKEWRMIEEERAATKERAIRHMINRCTSVAYQQWHGEWQRNKKHRAVAYRALKRMQNRILSSTFSSWLEEINRLAHMRQLSYKAAGAFINRQLHMAWARWVEAKSAMQEQRTKLTKAIGRIKLVAIFAGFNQWRSVIEENKARKALLRKAAGRLLYRHQRLAFAQWYDMLVTTKRQRAVVSKVMSKVLKREMAQGFELWTEYIESLKAHRVAEEKRRARRTRRCVTC
ncbi:protein SFI1 [Pseudoscourfieldia marina]